MAEAGGRPAGRDAGAPDHAHRTPTGGAGGPARVAGLAGLGLLVLALGVLVLRVVTLLRAGFHWDEFALFDGVARSLAQGSLQSGGRPGLAQLLVMPLVEGCRDEIHVGRLARGLWLVFTAGYGAGIYGLLREWLREPAHSTYRRHDAALGTALLVLLPAFLEVSIQVRTDQIALLGGIWGGVLLLRSERQPALAPAAGLLFGLGWLGSQKLAYVAALAALLAAARPLAALRTGGLAALDLRRDALRAALALGGFGAVLLAFGAIANALFTLPEAHPARQILGARLLGAQLESAREHVFPFYRMTIGYSQYRALLPTLVPHLALGVGLVAATVSALRRRGDGDPGSSRLATAWAVLALGLGVGAFHAGAFTYFWMTLGLFPAVAGALAVGPIRQRLRVAHPSLVRPLAIVLWAALVIPAVGAQLLLLRDTQRVQADSLAFVHRNFTPAHTGFQPEGALFCRPPQPMGIFFSQKLYRTFEHPRRDLRIERLIDVFRREPVHYLVNSFRLNQFPLEVRRFWSDHYQPYRAAVFVAGAQLGPAATDGGATGAEPFELLVSGPYRWLPGDRGPDADGASSVWIDGREVAPGAVVELTAGTHAARLSPGSPAGHLVLSMREPPSTAPLPFYPD